jgi:hypothetical protein
LNLLIHGTTITERGRSPNFFLAWTVNFFRSFNRCNPRGRANCKPAKSFKWEMGILGQNPKYCLCPTFSNSSHHQSSFIVITKRLMITYPPILDAKYSIWNQFISFPARILLSLPSLLAIDVVVIGIECWIDSLVMNLIGFQPVHSIAQNCQ